MTDSDSQSIYKSYLVDCYFFNDGAPSLVVVTVVVSSASPCNSDHANNFPAGQKSVEEKKTVYDKYVLIPWYPISYLTIAMVVL